MISAKLPDMKRGWYVGDFEPSVYKTSNVEVAVKKYQAGDGEQWHYHKISTEITVIVLGKVVMNCKEYTDGDIIMMEPGEGTDFRVLQDTITVVVKIPCELNDKYPR